LLQDVVVKVAEIGDLGLQVAAGTFKTTSLTTLTSRQACKETSKEKQESKSQEELSLKIRNLEAEQEIEKTLQRIFSRDKVELKQRRVG